MRNTQRSILSEKYLREKYPTKHTLVEKYLGVVYPKLVTRLLEREIEETADPEIAQKRVLEGTMFEDLMKPKKGTNIEIHFLSLTFIFENLELFLKAAEKANEENVNLLLGMATQEEGLCELMEWSGGLALDAVSTGITKNSYRTCNKESLKTNPFDEPY